MKEIALSVTPLRCVPSALGRPVRRRGRRGLVHRALRQARHYNRFTCSHQPASKEAADYIPDFD